MFFPERIVSIKKSDRVLEVGPGATPHPRSDTFLEMKFKTKEELVAQSGHVGIINTNKEIVFYDGNEFPFNDKEFNYIICSHVLEHVNNVPFFLNEIFRVGEMGYLEFPTFYYDFLYNIKEHCNVIMYKENKIFWCKKTNTPIPELSKISEFFNELKNNGYYFQRGINEIWHQGFEWKLSIENIEVKNWEELTYTKEQLMLLINNQKNENYLHHYYGVKYALKQLIREIIYKINTFF
jgi:SAM-dependent methyltransferase